MGKDDLKAEFERQAAAVDIQALENKLRYTFKDKTHLIRALTHPSISNDHNDRMEFRGDKMLGHYLSEMIEKNLPDYHAGDRTQFIGWVASNKFMENKIAKNWDLRSLIIHADHGNIGGKAISDCVEAMICAVYDDGGPDACRDFIQQHWGKYINEKAKSVRPIMRLREYFNEHGLGFVEFDRVPIGKKRSYTIEATVPAHGRFQHDFTEAAKAGTKMAAKIKVAKQILKRLGI